MKLVHGSLFSGFDAPSVAASWMGWKNAFHCEINPFCNDILKYWFPNSEHYEDITKTDFSQWRGRIDILTGGFPCQPFSLAGQRKGADDNRYLWPHMLRAIREIRPAWVIGENVAGILTMVQPGKETEVGSQTSLFGEDNRKRILLRQEYVVETICKDLERERYSVQPLLIPACAVGAPHRRDRVWFVARLITDTACRGSGGTPHESCCENERQNGYKTQQPFVRGCVRASSHSDGERCNNRSDNWKERPICYDQKRYSEENQSERTERKRRTCENGSVASDSQCSGSGQIQQKIQSKQSDGNSFDRNGSEWVLPTPIRRDYQPSVSPQTLKRKDGKMRTDSLCNLPVMLGEHCLQTGGRTSQLNPLFVEEMMGFPLMWTTLPFLSQNGDRNQLKDMETP